MTTTTQDTSAKYFVAKTNGTVIATSGPNAAKAYASRLYDLGVIAPLVVRAANADEAKAKAARCYAGEITTRQARA
jgi:threonine dehydratase